MHSIALMYLTVRKMCSLCFYVNANMIFQNDCAGCETLSMGEVETCRSPTAKARRNSPPLPWEDSTERFFRAIEKFDAYLSSDLPLHAPAEELFQGPVADATFWPISKQDESVRNNLRQEKNSIKLIVSRSY